MVNVASSLCLKCSLTNPKFCLGGCQRPVVAMYRVSQVGHSCSSELRINFPDFAALNELLREFGIALGESVLEGYFDMGAHGMYYASGTSIIRFPQINGAIIIERDLHDQGLEVSHEPSERVC